MDPAADHSSQAPADGLAQRLGLPASAADRAADLARVAVACTTIEAGPGRVVPAKTYGITDDGRPVVAQAGGQPAAGTARRRTFAGSAGEVLKQLGEILADMPSSAALVCAPPPFGRDAWPFVTRKDAVGRSDVIARTREHFAAPGGPALFGLDFDVKAWPAELRKRVGAEPGQISGILGRAAPCLAGAACLMRASSSAGIRNRRTGAATGAGDGQHRFLIALDGRDVERAAAALHERLILTGWGWPFLAESGFVEIRSLIDLHATRDLARLWFEGAVQLAHPDLELVEGARAPRLLSADGGPVDTAQIRDLDTEERERLEAVKREIAASVADEAANKRAAWIEKRRAALIAKGVDPDRAARAVGAAVERHVLTDDFEILLDDGTNVTVAEIVADPAGFHRATCADPLEPEYGGGRNKAIIFADARPIRIESQAHGGVSYVLQAFRDYFEPIVAPATAGPAASGASAAPLFDIDPDEPVDLFGDADPASLGEVPAGSLPDVIERWTATEARRKGVQSSFAALAAVVAASSAIGTSLRIAVRQHDSWSEPAGLWAVIVAPPGSAKSPVISAAVQPLRRLDAEWLKTDGVVHAEWSKAARRAKRGDVIGPEPRVRRAVVDDITAEKLVAVLAANPNGVLRDTDELSALLGGLGQYKKGADADRGQLLRMFDGGSISRDRQTTGSVFAETAFVSILAGSQPLKVASLVRDLGTDGLLQRFLVVQDDGVHRRGIDEAPDHAAVEAYEGAIRGLKRAEYHFASPVRMSPEAGAAFNETAERLDALRFVPGAHPAFQDHVAKWGKILPRLVLTFHAVEEFDRFGRVDPEKPLPIKTVEKAGRFARFLMAHSLRFYESFFGASEAASEARWIAGHLLTKPDLRELTPRDVYDARTTLRGAENRRALSAAMSELEAAKWVEAVAWKDGSATRWTVNPRVHSRFAERAAREKADRSAKHARIQAAGRERQRLVPGAWAEPAERLPVSASVFD